jgi:hypothetical protein
MQEINPNKDYNLTEVAEQELMGKGKTYFVCKNIITDELWKPEKERVLKATKVGEGKRSTYFIKGKNLIKYLKKQEQ